MSIVRKTISFTAKHDLWMKSRVASGEYATDSEYIRDLIRRDQSDIEKLTALKSAILEGLESGPSKRNVDDIVQLVKKGRKDADLSTEPQG